MERSRRLSQWPRCETMGLRTDWRHCLSQGEADCYMETAPPSPWAIGAPCVVRGIERNECLLLQPVNGTPLLRREGSSLWRRCPWRSPSPPKWLSKEILQVHPALARHSTIFSVFLYFKDALVPLWIEGLTALPTLPLHLAQAQCHEKFGGNRMKSNQGHAGWW